MSNLSELLPAGAGAKSASFVASGTLGSGVTVALKADGTVEAVSAVDESLGSSAQISTGNFAYPVGVYDSTNNKVVVVYSGPSNRAYAVVGQISGTSISFGSEVLAVATTAYYQAGAFDANTGKVLLCYSDYDNSEYGKAVVGTVSGTSISFGSVSTFNSSATSYISAIYDPAAQKIVIGYKDGSYPANGSLIAATISGTSVSFGAESTFNSGSAQFVSLTYNSAEDKILVFYQDQGNSRYPTCRVASLSGTSFSYGTETVLASRAVENTGGAYTTSGKHFLVFRNDGSPNNLSSVVVATVSGNSVSFGTEAATTARFSNSYVPVVYNAKADKVIIFGRNQENSYYPTYLTASISGTNITLSTPVVAQSVTSYEQGAVYDPTEEKSALFWPTSSRTIPVGAVLTSASSNNTGFIGITDQAIADTATGAVIVQGGVSEKLSGLTVGADYYVQDGGSLASSSIPFDISGASYDSVSFDVSAQEITPTSIRFNTTGTKMFVLGESSDNVNEYNLSIAFDISTASFSQSFSVSTQEIQPRGLAFNNDGTKMFVTGGSGDDVNEYTLSTGFDVSTATYSQNFSVSAQIISPSGIAFNSDGTKMFICGSTNDSVFEYALTSGFNVSTASFIDSISVASEEASPFDIAFNPEGNKMFIAGATGDAVYEYILSAAFDISTAVYSTNFSVAGQEATIQGIAFNESGTKFYITGSTTDAAYQYSTTAASTTVPAGRALSSTSILLEG
jgi:hypothetical protein